MNLIIPLISTIGCTFIGYLYGRLRTRYYYQRLIEYRASQLRFATRHCCSDLPRIIDEMEKDAA